MADITEILLYIFELLKDQKIILSNILISVKAVGQISFMKFLKMVLSGCACWALSIQDGGSSDQLLGLPIVMCNL